MSKPSNDELKRKRKNPKQVKSSKTRVMAKHQKFKVKIKLVESISKKERKKKLWSIFDLLLSNNKKQIKDTR